MHELTCVGIPKEAMNNRQYVDKYVHVLKFKHVLSLCVYDTGCK